MTIPNSPDAIGNVFRLAGLKNVAGRRRVRGETPYLENLDAIPDTDLAGTAETTPPVNVPQAETGAQLEPQSYDVRANEIIPPEESVFTKLGRSLGARAGQSKNLPELDFAEDPFARLEDQNIEPPVATQQVEEAEGLPPVNPEMENNPVWPAAPIFKALGQELKREFSKAPIQEGPIFKGLGNEYGQLNPEQQKILQEHEDAKQVAMQEGIARAQENPGQVVVNGATGEFAKNDALKQEFQDTTGIAVTPEMEAEIMRAEMVASNLENNDNEAEIEGDDQARRLRERILSNSATDMDKYYIGLALLMPLIIGGFFGKEAGLGALGGAAQGLGKVFENRAENVRKDEELLADINKNSAALNLKRGEGQVNFNPNIRPGLVANPAYLTSEDDRKELIKSAKELQPVRVYVDELNDLTEDIVEIASQLKDPENLKQLMIIGLKNKLPNGALSKLSPEVMYKGKKVNSGTLLATKLGLLANQYARAQKLGQLDSAAQRHMGNIVQNPADTLVSPQDAINEILEIRKLAQDGLIRDAGYAGFEPERLEEYFDEKNKKLYGGLQQKENLKESDKALR